MAAEWTLSASSVMTASVAVAVDTVGGEGGRHELHEAASAGAGRRVVAAVVGLLHPDPREQRPRQPVLGRGCLVERRTEAGISDGRLVRLALTRAPGLRQTDRGRRRGAGVPTTAGVASVVTNNTNASGTVSRAPSESARAQAIVFIVSSFRSFFRQAF